MTWIGCNAWCERKDGISCPEDSCDIADGVFEPIGDPESVAFRPLAECIEVVKANQRAISEAFGIPRRLLSSGPRR